MKSTVDQDMLPFLEKKVEQLFKLDIAEGQGEGEQEPTTTESTKTSKPLLQDSTDGSSAIIPVSDEEEEDLGDELPNHVLLDWMREMAPDAALSLKDVSPERSPTPSKENVSGIYFPLSLQYSKL